MRENINKVSYRGISTTSVLGIVFIVLKLLNKITWSWVWVLAPFWMPLLIAMLVALVCLLLLFIEKE